ncbi:MAG: hypothetical protein J6Y91_04380, partial [Alphaproteobacteria bacterium]|nr:hypothetical protein [Alphaproteobacteria bacterium]
MTYTRSAIGLLTRQYRSVLRKCFLINCGLFALGAVSVADAAAPKPTLDDLQSKTEEKISILGTYLGTYALTELGSSETAPAGTTAISFNGKRYYYTTPTTLDADKTNMLKYLSGSTAVAMTSTGATAANSVFSISGTNYTFDKTKLPVSVWTPIDGTASDYDYYTYADDNITKEYHKFSFKENDKIVWTDNGSTAIGSYPNAYVSGSNATVSGNTITGAIRMKMPHNGIAPTDWNRYFTYTYTKPTDYQITQTRLNDNVTADNVNLKVFTKISNTSDGAIYMSFGDSFTNIETTGGAIRNAKTINEIESDFIGNELKVNGFSDSCGGWCGADGIGFGGAINNMGTIDTITGNFVANNVYRTSTNNYAALGLGGAISNLNGTTISIIGNFVGNSATGTLGYGGAISNASMTDNGKDTTIVSIIGDFIGNKASGAGGAISNMSQYFGKKATISSITGDFIGNSADYYGGAIFNGTANPFTTNACYPEYASGTTLTLANTTFINNGANNKPNSIYNAGVINIANGATVTINDGYDGLSQGQLKVGISASSGSILNLSVDNGVLQTDNLGTVTNNGTMNWDLDVDLIDTNSDKITVTSLSG